MAGAPPSRPPRGRQGPVGAPVVLDHVLVGTADLEQGNDVLERLTGVRPVVGGSHPDWGSHNSLLALGSTSYLELVALRPEAAASGPFASLRSLSRPTPVGWALATTDIDQTRHQLEAAGFHPSAITDGSRQRPDGTRLEWRTLGFEEKPMVGPWPFFIEWGAMSVHPATDSPDGCILSRVALAGPQVEALAALRDLLDLEVDLAIAEREGMTLDLETPAGPVTLAALGAK